VSVDRLPGPPDASFSAAVVTTGQGRVVHISGQLGPGPDVAAQTSRCFDQIDAILREAGGSLENVVRIRAYLISFDEYPAFARVRRERFSDGLPASTVVMVAGLLQGGLIEIDADAYLEQE
jgi:2-iminobutanoate/2-iminopropanoate deaminase